MSKIDICNQALSYITSKRIVSFDNKGKEEEICGLFYDETRIELLSVFPWNFSLMTIKAPNLAELDTLGWGYIHQYPSNAVVIRSVSSNPIPSANNYYDTSGVSLNNGSNYRVSMHPFDNKKYIFSNISNPYITYTYDINDTSMFDPYFKLCLTYLLAHKISMPLTGNHEIAQQMFSYYSINLATAKATNAQEGNELVFDNNEYLNARM